MNIIIPMAGAGSRFAKVGYTFPKPLIDVKGKPMIQVVTENLNISFSEFTNTITKVLNGTPNTSDQKKD